MRLAGRLLTPRCPVVQFLWDAADVGDEPAEEEDFDMGAEEPKAAPAAEETDFDKRMAALAQAFS